MDEEMDENKAMDEAEIDEYGDEHPLSTKDALKEKSMDEEMDENYMDEEMDEMKKSMDEMDLDELLRELEDMDEEMDENMDETINDPRGPGAHGNIAPTAQSDTDLNEAKEGEEEESEEDVEIDIENMSEEDLKSFIESVIADMVKAGELEAGHEGMENEEGAEEEESEEEEISIDELMSELSERKKYGGNKGDVPASKRGDKKDTAEEEGVEDYKKKKKKENLKEDVNAIDITAVSTVVGVATAILAPLFNALSKAETLEEKQAVRNQLGNAIKGAKGIREAELQNDLTTLREELQEVNLLNAKLLYVNKIFKAKNLSEAQKLKVVKAFDKAESAKEAKLVYESLSETFSARTDKNQIKESLGFASKAAGIAPQKQQIVEGNDFIARMQKLANIK